MVFIADEVQTGFAALARGSPAITRIVPDLITMAKGHRWRHATGRGDRSRGLLDSVHTGGLGGTYGGNPVACAAALAALDVMERDDLSGRARAINDRVTTRLSALSDGSASSVRSVVVAR